MLGIFQQYQWLNPTVSTINLKWIKHWNQMGEIVRLEKNAEPKPCFVYKSHILNIKE